MFLAFEPKKVTLSICASCGFYQQMLADRDNVIYHAFLRFLWLLHLV